MQFRVEGLRKTLKAMEAAGTDAENLKDLMHAVGEIVVSSARPIAPVKTGALEGTIRAGRGKTKAVVRAGRAAVPYAGPIHYGWPAHNITGQPFLTDALQAERSQVFEQLEQGIDSLLRKEHLK